MKLVLLALVLVGFCFDINSGCCGCCKRNNDGNGGGGLGNLGSKNSVPGGGPGKPTPAETDKFDAEIIVGSNNVTIKFPNKEIVLNENHLVKMEEIRLIYNSYTGGSRVYKLESGNMIMNAKVTVSDNKLKKNSYLIAIAGLKGDESNKYIVIAYERHGSMVDLFNNAASVSILSSAGITNMNGMFHGCNDLTVCNINIDTSKVIDMGYMFKGCSSLTSLSVTSKLDTSKVEDMSEMFYGCSSLESLPDISKWNTSNVTNMKGMFYNCSSLSSLPDISKWNTGKVTDMSEMFFGCKSLSPLPDIFKWDISNVTNMDYMFFGCDALDKLKSLDKFKPKK